MILMQARAQNLQTLMQKMGDVYYKPSLRSKLISGAMTTLDYAHKGDVGRSANGMLSITRSVGHLVEMAELIALPWTTRVTSERLQNFSFHRAGGVLNSHRNLRLSCGLYIA